MRSSVLGPLSDVVTIALEGVFTNAEASGISVNVGRAVFQLPFKCPLFSISSFSLNYGEILLYLTIQEHSSMKTRGG